MKSMKSMKNRFCFLLRKIKKTVFFRALPCAMLVLSSLSVYSVVNFTFRMSLEVACTAPEGRNITVARGD
jgi:hypothetical protein